jgi:hypothetical protein
MTRHWLKVRISAGEMGNDVPALDSGEITQNDLSEEAMYSQEQTLLGLFSELLEGQVVKAKRSKS